MKRLSIFVVMTFTLILGAFIVFSDLVLDSGINNHSINVFDSLLWFLAALMGIAEFGKKIENKNTEQIVSDEIEGSDA